MTNQARSRYGAGGDYRDEVLEYLQQSAEADEKLLQYTQELVQEYESQAFEVQERFQAHLRDLHLYQGFIDCTINHLLNLAEQYDQVPDELQFRLVAMDGMAEHLHRVALSTQEQHERALAALLDMKDIIETLKMQQAEALRAQQEDRPEPCFVRILRIWCSLL